MTFKEGAGDECAAAVALVLFGNSDTILPGGYAGEEISENSPINQVTEFPQELVLLGKFTHPGEKSKRREGKHHYLTDIYFIETQRQCSSVFYLSLIISPLFFLF